VGYVAGHGNSEAISVSSPGFTALPQQNTTSPNLVSVKSGYQDLSTQVALSHYSTFSFYEPTVLKASLEEFLQRVRSPVVRWADENLLVTVHRI